MCCITIDTEVLLDNYFGSEKYIKLEKEGCSEINEIESIRKFAKILANNLPGYVFYDLSPQKISEVTTNNKNYIQNGDKIFYTGDTIDRASCNSIYTNNISTIMDALVDDFFAEKLYTKRVDILAPIY